MGLTPFTNTADSSGTLGTALAAITSGVTVQLTDDVAMTLAADREIWINGLLMYTITIKNDSTDLDYEVPALTDYLDPARITLVTDSVTLDDAPFTEFTVVDNVLTMTLPNVEKNGGTRKVTFQVEKVAP